jgi:hypothetical protein
MIIVDGDRPCNNGPIEQNVLKILLLICFRIWPVLLKPKFICTFTYSLPEIHFGTILQLKFCVNLSLLHVCYIYSSHLPCFNHLRVSSCRSQWPLRLRHEMSSPSEALGSWVRIPLDAWMSARVSSLFVLSCVGNSLVTGLITHPRGSINCL